MTKKHDSYISGFDAGMPGIRAAVYDVGLALDILEEIAKEHELLRERKTFSNGQGWTVAQVLEIANEALNQSISPVSWIYERLQQNAEAAEIVSCAELTDIDTEGVLLDSRWALARTLNNKAILPRRVVSRARREIERRETVRKSSDDSPVECERCGVVVVEYPLYEHHGERLCSSCCGAALLVEERRESGAKHAS